MFIFLYVSNSFHQVAQNVVNLISFLICTQFMENQGILLNVTSKNQLEARYSLCKLLESTSFVCFMGACDTVVKVPWDEK